MDDKYIDLGEVRQVDPKDLRVDPALDPPRDPGFTARLELALEGKLPLYYAEVPLALLRPFAPQYNPAAHPIAAQVIEAIMREWRAGKFRKMLGYEAAGFVIISDDYLTLDAIRRGEPDFAPLWILGKPTIPALQNVQGPIAHKDVRPILGFSPQP